MLKASTKSKHHSSLALATTQRLPLPSALSDADLPTPVGSLDLGTSHGESQSHDKPCKAPYPTLTVSVPYRHGPPHGAASVLAAPLLPAAHVVTQPPGQEVNPCRDGQEIVQQVAHTHAGPAGPGPRRHPSDWHCRWSPRRAEMLLPKGGASTSVRSPPAMGPTWRPVGDGHFGAHHRHCSVLVVPRTFSCLLPLPDRGLRAQHLGTGREKRHRVTACAGTSPSWGPCCSWGIGLAPGSNALSVEELGPARPAARGRGVRAGSAPGQHLLHHRGWGNVAKLNPGHWC